MSSQTSSDNGPAGFAVAELPPKMAAVGLADADDDEEDEVDDDLIRLDAELPLPADGDEADVLGALALALPVLPLLRSFSRGSYFLSFSRVLPLFRSFFLSFVRSSFRSLMCDCFLSFVIAFCVFVR